MQQIVPYRYGNHAALFGGASGPPIPSFANTVAAWGLWDWNPLGFVDNIAVAVADGNDDGQTLQFPSPLSSPYSGRWESLWNGGPPIYRANAFVDQNGEANSLTATGSARPTLQVTTSVFVDGVEYTYRGQTNSFAYYNKLGQSTSTSNWVIKYDGINDWIRTDGSGVTVAITDGSSVAFPWLDFNWTGPLPTAGTGAGQMQFDGAANGMAGAAGLFASGLSTASLYFDIQPTNLATSGTIFETGSFANVGARAFQFSLRQEANQLVWRAYDEVGTGINSKTFTLTNTNRIFVCVQIDSVQGTAANQTAMLINNSATGVTSPASANLAGGLLGPGLPNLGARNNAASNFFTGNIWNVVVNNTADDAATKTQYFDWNTVQHA